MRAFQCAGDDHARRVAPAGVCTEMYGPCVYRELRPY
jgi:hypothetical protein